jgi:NitT/TauT family transport system substrate-binding protein
LLKAIVALLLGAAIGLAALPARSQSKIAIGYSPTVDFVPLFVAQDQGLLAKHGLDATLTAIPVANNDPPALTSHSIDIGVGTMPTLLLAAENGLDFVIVAGYTRNLASDPQTSLMTRPGFAYKTAADLKGKHVGTPGLLSSFDIHFRKWLSLNHMTAGDVTLIEAKFNQMGDMMKGGLLDAAIVIEPFRSQFAQSGAAVRAVDFLGEVTQNDAGAFWMALPDWASSHPKERAAFRAALEDGIAAVERDPAMAKAEMEKYLHFSTPVASDWSLDITPDDVRFYQDMMQEFGMVKSRVDPAQFIAK